ncbi:MAG TPA: LPS assembly protein LptD, partial [Nitrospiria bacterium]
SRARADMGQYLVARGVVFTIKDIPVFYTPYLILPIKTERQSGLLIPRMGYSTRDGLRFNESFFWAIGPSQDATFSLDYRSMRGIGGGVEYRYKISRGSEGELRFNVFEDRQTLSRRTETEFRHTQRFSEDFQARLDVHLVNDNSRLRDLSDTTEDRTRQSLVSNFIVFRRWEMQEVYLLARWTRDLLDTTRSTLQVLPQAGYTLREIRLGPLPLYASLDATAVHFWREEEDQAAGLIRAVRLDAFPRFWMTMRAGPVTLKPGFGYRETWYSRDLASDLPAHRGVEVLSLAAATRFSRLFGASSGRSLLHVVEPSVVYEYVPYRDQSRLPHFDEADQLPRKNHLTYSLANRLVAENSTDPAAPVRREWVYWKLSQAYDLHEVRTRNDPGPSRPFSNFRSQATLRPFEPAALNLDAFYNPYRKETVTFNSDLRLHAGRIGSVSVGQRYSREGVVTPRGDVFNPESPEDRAFWYSESGPLIRFLTGAAGVALGEHLALAARAYYDLAARSFAELDYGLEYSGQCWGFTLTYQDLPDRNQVSFMITLRPGDLTGDKSVLHTIGPGI